MANLVNNHYKQKGPNGTINISSDDIRALLVQNNTTVDTEPDVEFLSEYTTLAEVTVTGYARLALTSEALNLDLANDRAEFTADALVYASLAAGGNPIQGVLLYKEGASDAARRPIVFLEFASVFTPNGGGLNVNPNAEGLLQFV